MREDRWCLFFLAHVCADITLDFPISFLRFVSCTVVADSGVTGHEVFCDAKDQHVPAFRGGEIAFHFFNTWNPQTWRFWLLNIPPILSIFINLNTQTDISIYPNQHFLRVTHESQGLNSHSELNPLPAASTVFCFFDTKVAPNLWKRFRLYTHLSTAMFFVNAFFHNMLGTN